MTIKPSSSPSSPDQARSRVFGRLKRRALIVAAVALTGLALGEVSLRQIWGLGSPPLLQGDRQTVYRYVPNQKLTRDGNSIRINQWSMRGDDLPTIKPSGERRVLVFGDSIVNGGSLTDQAELATEILQESINKELTAQIRVGNISAGSWAVPNSLGYLRRYGSFDADVIVIVVSTHDAGYLMPKKSDDWKQHGPWSAWEELGLKLNLLSADVVGLGIPDAPPTVDAKSMAVVSPSVEALGEFIELARQKGAVPVVATYLERDEDIDHPLPGQLAFVEMATKHGAKIVDLGRAFRDHKNPSPYRDHIHPNAVGQHLMADALLPAILDALDTRASSGPSPPPTPIPSR